MNMFVCICTHFGTCLRVCVHCLLTLVLHAGESGEQDANPDALVQDFLLWKGYLALLDLQPVLDSLRRVGSWCSVRRHSSMRGTFQDSTKRCLQNRFDCNVTALQASCMRSPKYLMHQKLSSLRASLQGGDREIMCFRSLSGHPVPRHLQIIALVQAAFSDVSRSREEELNHACNVFQLNHACNVFHGLITFTLACWVTSLHAQSFWSDICSHWLAVFLVHTFKIGRNILEVCLYICRVHFAILKSFVEGFWRRALYLQKQIRLYSVIPSCPCILYRQLKFSWWFLDTCTVSVLHKACICQGQCCCVNACMHFDTHAFAAWLQMYCISDLILESD